MVSLLSGPARQWGTVEWSRKSPVCSSYKHFAKDLLLTFDPARPKKESALRLAEVKQGSRSVSQYSIEFRTLAADSDWNDSALHTMFFKGLSERVKDELASRELLDELDKLIDLAKRIDCRILERTPTRAFVRRPPPAPRRFLPGSTLLSPVPESHSQGSNTRNSSPEPMQIGRTKLTPEEKERRFKNNLCLYCGGVGH